MATIETADFVMIKRADLETLLRRIDEVEQLVQKYKHASVMADRAMLLSRGGMLSSADVCKLMNWSTSTLHRRLRDGNIIMTKVGSSYKIDIDDFFEWYNQNFKN